MADRASSSSDTQKTAKNLTPKEIVEGFQRMREQQQLIVSKLAELDQEQTEHRIVIETLEELEGSRKCFRLINGVLVERTVVDVIPELKDNKAKVASLVESLKGKLTTQAQHLADYREKHNLRFVNELTTAERNQLADASKQDQKVASSGVLVE